MKNRMLTGFDSDMISPKEIFSKLVGACQCKFVEVFEVSEYGFVCYICILFFVEIWLSDCSWDNVKRKRSKICCLEKLFQI
jgi:hypothetical protein